MSLTGGDEILASPMPRAASCDAAGIDARGCGNVLLRALSAADFALLAPHLERVPLVSGSRLATAGEPIDTLCFMEGGIGGFLDVLADGRRLAVGLVGREGFVGWPLLMGNDRWPYDVDVRARDCTALRMRTGPLLAAIERSPTLHAILLRFAGTFMAQMGQTIVSNLIHPVPRRMARWILLYHDRLDGDEIALTHEELSAMLGVRRASATDALHELEGRQVIRNLRGRVIVRDRAGLREIAGEAYGFAEQEYRRLIGAFASAA